MGGIRRLNVCAGHMETSRQISPARIAAIVALIAALIALVVVISSSTGGGSDQEAGPGSAGTTTEKRASGPGTYKVKQGDTLCAIADKFSIDCQALQQLNPKIDQFSLHAGQTVKLR